MRTFIYAAIFAVAITAQHPYVGYANSDPDTKLTFEEICIKNGFQVEVHPVTTQDGYILNVFRIPGLASDHQHANISKPPILMQHGILDSANCWIINYADVAPAFVAARAGYDVWLGNSRGNTFSLGHTTWDHDKNEAKYWNFSWYEMGKYDIPAVIDMIQRKTGGQKVAYIGHSQGTTQMFTALSTNQAYFKDKVPLFVALGPVTKISHTEAEVFQWGENFYSELADTCSLLDIHSIMDANWFTSTVSQFFCSHIPLFCELIEKLFATHQPKLDDTDRFAVYMGHYPNGASMKAIFHYTQNLREDRFQVFADDYEDFFNRHQKRTTNLYPLEKITEVPVAIFTGLYDPLADLTDERWTRDTIGKKVVHYEEINAGHLTFLIGKDMTYFTKGVMGLLK